MKSKMKWLMCALAMGLTLQGCSSDDDEALQNGVKSGTNGHDYVDLGLSVMWATCNVGADSPSEYGDYFGWGNTKDYTISTDCYSGTEDIAGNPLYDAALANWGGSWRLPTADEIDELVDDCQWEWTTVGDVEGYKVTGSNGNSIFLPAAGWHLGAMLYDDGDMGWYWSSTPHESKSNEAYLLYFYNGRFFRYWVPRGNGRSVRPVIAKGDITAQSKEESSTQSGGKTDANGHDYVDLGLSVKWATCNVGATLPSDYGAYFAWGEIKTKSEYNANSTWYDVEVDEETIKGNPDYDAARAYWGGTWRLPTADEISELVDKCLWAWATQDEVKGYQVTGPSGNSIFLPAAGYHYVSTYSGSILSNAGSYGYYWSCSPNTGNTNNSAYYLRFYSGSFELYSGWNRNGYYYGRGFGQSVRPVTE
ncbi:MAG: DUF1566 domain-containing protein [Porphyromonadaceae bacterium]|nr:DUF1566 domain-containing protein [Porphyromonadaceae bacterium]